VPARSGGQASGGSAGRCPASAQRGIWTPSKNRRAWPGATAAFFGYP